MQAVILGAGRGRRLGDEGGFLPKPLLELDGRTVLDRQLATIREVFPEIDRYVVVVGFGADAMRQAGGDGLCYVVNDAFDTTNTAASLRLAFAASPEDTLLLNGDVLIDEAALAPMREPDSAALCELKPDVVDEEVQVRLDGDRIVGIGKAIGGAGEAVGIYRLPAALAKSYLDAYDDADANTYYEDVLNRLLDEHGFFAVRLPAGAVATEIDTPEDLARARALLGG
jgi:CDP-glycerol glycerophosphotransferase